MRARITIESTGDKPVGTRIRIEEGQVVRFGRHASADVTVADNQISGLHFALQCDAARCRIRDLQSTNGTWVNEIKVNLIELTDGDTFKAGNTTFSISFEGSVNQTVNDPEVYPELRALQAKEEANTGPAVGAPEFQPASMDAPHLGLDLNPAPLDVSSAPVVNPNIVSDEPAAAVDPGSLPDTGADPVAIVPAEMSEANVRPVSRMILNFQDQSGPRRVWLVPGQTVIIGRTEMADVTVTGDGQISSAHFAVDCNAEKCKVRDLQSQNGILLNDTKVPHASIYDGDQIQAGDTQFIVQVQGGPEAPGAALRTWSPGNQAEAPLAGSHQFATYHKTKINDELFAFEQVESDPPPIELIRRLARNRTFYLVIDPLKVGKISSQIDSVETKYLIDWVPEVTAEAMSPLIHKICDVEQNIDYLSEVWGRDGAMLFFPVNDDGPLFDHLISLAKYYPEESQLPEGVTEAPPSMLIYYWPSVLSMLIVNKNFPLAKRFLENVEFAVGQGESPETWKAYARKPFQEKLIAAGFMEFTESEEEPEEPPVEDDSGESASQDA
ncbi:MAG: hypothetical protein COA78_02595 [Blastopirellula sp.]|nr:MAG: hypothetical protein COA78_02595 [Blastopirellula sp.]